jgi:hypothetical protein
MFQRIGSMFGGGGKPQPANGQSRPAGHSAPVGRPMDRKPTYSKVFRWSLPEGQTEEPRTVEVVGSFTGWQRVPLLKDSKVKTWHATVQNIPGNKTHHYMLLVNGEPTLDKGCDGYALPDGEYEERYAIQTARGPRLFMLFAQTK